MSKLDETVDEPEACAGEQTLETLPLESNQLRLAAAMHDPMLPGLSSLRAMDDSLDTNDGVLRIGRYTILRKLGEGGMGVVYACYDEQLDRKLAVKLLLSRARDRDANLRLEREARGLAKLSHPNVVQIYEIGVYRDALFLAMEFVSGQTLRDWLKVERAFDLHERVRLLLQTGRGLAAAHAAALIHRDFKPANVIIGDDGRARVLDFGLVRGARAPEVSVESVEREAPQIAAEIDIEAVTVPSEPGAQASGSDLLQRPLTLPGSIMGTPGYMAPEQLAGQACDALADQFAFCVVAFETLFGQRPFPGESFRALLASVSSGRIVMPEGAPAVPRRMREAIVRGLAVAPEQRWPSMDALLGELEAALRELEGRPRGWWGWGLGAGLASVGAVAVGLLLSQPEPCTFDESALQGTWDTDRRERVRAVFTDSNLDFADNTFAIIESKLDTWADTWLEAQRSSCRATVIERVQPQALLERRSACLDRKRRDLDATVELLEAGAPATLAGAIELVAALPQIDACADLERLADPFPLPADSTQVAAIETARDELAAARARWLIGDTDEAQQQLDALAPQIRESGYLPLELEYRLLVGEIRLQRREFEVVDELRTVAHEAQAHGLDDLLADVWTTLAVGTAGRWSEPVLEAWIIDNADAATRKLNRTNDPRSIELLGARGHLERQRGNQQEALAYFEDSRKRADTLERPDLVVVAERNIANAYADLGRFDEAEAQLGKTEAHAREQFGPGSPVVAQVLLDAGLVALSQEDFERAGDRLERARILFVATHGQSNWVAHVDFGLAKLATSNGDYKRARKLVDGALRTFERELGPKHELTGQAYNAQGVLRYYYDDFVGSLESYRHALEIQTPLLGSEHEQIGILQSNIGESLLALGEEADAHAAFERAIATLSRTPNNPHLGLPLKGRGLISLERGEPERALEDLTRARALLQDSGEPIELAEIVFALARASMDAGREPDEARNMARAALEIFVEYDVDERARAVEAWLAH